MLQFCFLMAFAFGTLFDELSPDQKRGDCTLTVHSPQ